jgi:histidinol-phosphatase (PHP family)
MDYHPDDEAEIEAFLASAGFDYAIGSVHYLDGVNVHVQEYFGRKDEAERHDLVASYYDNLVALADSELFDIAAHLDLVERNPALRGLGTEEQFHRVAEAFERSATVPEINAGRVHAEHGKLHPGPDFFSVLQEHDVAFTLGSDSHEPDAVPARKEELETFVAANGLDIVDVAE